MSQTPTYQPPPPRPQPVAGSPVPPSAPGFGWTELLVRIAQFARHPKLALPRPPGSTPGFLFKMLVIDLAIRIATVPLVLLGAQLLDGAEYTALDTPDGESLNKMAIFVLAVIVAPLWEEAAMRLQIHPWSEWRFWLSLVLWGVFVGSTAFTIGGGAWLLVVMPAMLLLWRLVNLARGREATAAQWNAHPGLVVWFVTIGFGLMHLSNYSIPVDNWRLAVVFLLVLPQLFAGLLLAYTRVRLGYWGSVAHHALSNGLLIIPVLSAL